MSCSTLPQKKIPRYAFPKKKAFLDAPPWPYQVLGTVRSRMDFSTLLTEEEWSDEELCRNFYNRAVQKLVKQAQRHGADAVAFVRSVSVYLDHTVELSREPACSDEGGMGQVLVAGKAVKKKRRILDELVPKERR